jgi:hypothetical protein
VFEGVAVGEDIRRPVQAHDLLGGLLLEPGEPPAELVGAGQQFDALAGAGGLAERAVDGLEFGGRVGDPAEVGVGVADQGGEGGGGADGRPAGRAARDSEGGEHHGTRAVQIVRGDGFDAVAMHLHYICIKGDGLRGADTGRELHQKHLLGRVRSARRHRVDDSDL